MSTDGPRRDDFSQRSQEETRAARDALHHLSRVRIIPKPSDLARRRRLLSFAKWALPGAAALLLGAIAAWPEIQRLMNANHAAERELAALRVEGGNMEGAIYRGLDTHGRPFMITARTTRQVGADRFNLTAPVADTLLQGGAWVEVVADKGVYQQHAQTLDLMGHVVLYRDDGTILNGPDADIDLKRGIIASDDWVHGEGPFGVMDAQGYLLDEHGGIGQFRGPARMILNADRNSGPRDKAPSPPASRASR